MTFHDSSNSSTNGWPFAKSTSNQLTDQISIEYLLPSTKKNTQPRVKLTQKAATRGAVELQLKYKNIQLRQKVNEGHMLIASCTHMEHMDTYGIYIWIHMAHTYGTSWNIVPTIYMQAGCLTLGLYFTQNTAAYLYSTVWLMTAIAELHLTSLQSCSFRHRRASGALCRAYQAGAF